MNPLRLCYSAPVTRRDVLLRTGLGLGWLGAASLLETEAAAANAGVAPEPIHRSLAPRPPHFPARARAVIHLFANGGPSHLDTFDRKVALEKYAGQEVPGTLPTERRTGAALPSPFAFRRHGESGLEISDARRCPQSRAVADAHELRR